MRELTSEQMKKQMSGAKIAVFFMLATVGLAAFHFIKLVIDAGAFKKLAPHSMERCRVAATLTGAEDMEIVDRRLYISTDHRPERAGEPTPSGDLFVWEIDDPNAKPERLTKALPFAFHPHGISAIKTSTGTRLFVVNHRPAESVIEVFDHIDPVVEKGQRAAANKEAGQTVRRRFEHRHTLLDPLLTAPNDIAAVSEDEFYVSNDHGSRSPLWQAFEAYTRLGRGSLVFYGRTGDSPARTTGNDDGSARHGFRKVVSRLNFANGLWLTPDRALLLVAVMLDRQIQIYRRVADGINLVAKIDLDTAPDNIQLDAAGDLWIGAHPNLFDLKAHAANHALSAPAQILRLRAPQVTKNLMPAAAPHASTSPPAQAAEEIFLDDGKIVSAASIAVRDGHRLFVGSIFDSKILECRLP